jgi:hypothetical protein
MTTKPPSPIKKAPDNSLEHAAYASVAGIPVEDSRDLDRLGYSVWRWLSMRRDTLEQAVRSAHVRLKVSPDEAVKTIRGRLQELGVKMPE